MSAKFAAFGIVALVLFGFVAYPRGGDPTRDSDSAASSDARSSRDARALVHDGALLLDVRTAEEFAEGHVEGATNVPVQELAGRLGELSSKDRTVVVYCRSGARSARAAEILRSAGFSSVHDLGPMSAW